MKSCHIPLTLETHEQVEDKDTNAFAESIDADVLRHSGEGRSEDEQTSVPALAVSEGSQTADVGHPITPEVD